jgi:hypothetical protein
MFIRFVTQFQNERGEMETGVFQASAFLRGNIHTFDHDKAQLKELAKWFGANLDAPDRFSRSKSKTPANVSLSWFKSSATGHLQKMYELKEVLERYEMVIEVVMRENPGYIVYEDEYQVSTIPHKADRNKVK